MLSKWVATYSQSTDSVLDIELIDLVQKHSDLDNDEASKHVPTGSVSGQVFVWSGSMGQWQTLTIDHSDLNNDEPMKHVPAGYAVDKYLTYNGSALVWGAIAMPDVPEVPECTIFISPNFTDNYPFYSTIQAAISAAASNPTDLFVVYPGEYSDSLPFEFAGNWHLYAGVAIIDTVIEIRTFVKVTGDALLSSSGDVLSLIGGGLYLECSEINGNVDLIPGSPLTNDVIIVAKHSINGQVDCGSTGEYKTRIEAKYLQHVKAAGDATVEIKCYEFLQLETWTSAVITCDFVYCRHADSEPYVRVYDNSGIWLKSGEMYVPGDSGVPCCAASKGTIRLENVTCRNDNGVFCVGLSDALLIADNCVFVTNGTSSIEGTGNEDVVNYGSVANRATSGVNVLVDTTLKVDTNVI